MERYFYSKGGSNVHGPIALDDLQQMAAQGILPPETQVCLEGAENWEPIAAVAVVGAVAPGASMVDKPDATTVDKETSDWFYAKDGKRIGPISKIDIRRLIFAGSLSRDSPVWQSGMSDWTPADQTHLRELFLAGREPPPLTGESVDNRIVWAIAFVPLVAPLLEAFLAAGSHSPRSNFWGVALILNIILCVIDLRKLQNAGYNTDGMLLGALFLIPLYLFDRARRLKQNNAYAFVWLITFFISLFL